MEAMETIKENEFMWTNYHHITITH